MAAPFDPNYDSAIPRRWLAALFLGGLALAARAEDFPQDPLGWPTVTSTNKPWTRWWWLGSAVDKPNLTRQLEDFAQTGLGGVEISPIYGAVGAEDRSLKFLSPGWLAMLGHTTTEAQRLGLGVDMTTGTGWPFGGPQVTPEMASSGLRVIRTQASGGTRVSLDIPAGNLECLRALPESDPAVDLAAYVKLGKLDWLPPAGKWTIVGLTSSAPVQKVKRAAPGGEGNVLEPFSATAITRYLPLFTVHNQETWLWPMPFYKTSMELWKSGITFDYASGDMLTRATVSRGKLIHGGRAYSALVLPGVNRLPPETLEIILNLARQGAPLIVQGGWPSDVPGFHQQKEKRERLLAIESETTDIATVTQVRDSILPALASLGVFKETMTAAGLRFVRRSHDGGYHYFIVNRSEVTNLAANRIADLDRRKIPWKQFHEINFVNIDYKLFDAAAWPAMDSGLLGPVTLFVH